MPSKRVRAGDITALVSDTEHNGIKCKMLSSCLHVPYDCLQVGVSARSRGPRWPPLPLPSSSQPEESEHRGVKGAKHLQECRGWGREPAYLAASRHLFAPT